MTCDNSCTVSINSEEMEALVMSLMVPPNKRFSCVNIKMLITNTNKSFAKAYDVVKIGAICQPFSDS